MQYRLTTRFVVDAHGNILSPEAPVPDIATAARHYAAREYTAAGDVALQIIARQPRHFDALHLLGVLSLNAGRLADSMSFLRRAERERPDVALLQLHIGNVLLALQLYGNAQAAFRSSLTLRPGDFDALNNLGNSLAGDGRHEDAIECFHQALVVRPDAPPALYNLGRSLFALDRLEEATESFRAMLLHRQGVQPERLVDACSALCQALIEQERYEEALESCRGVPPEIMGHPTIEWNESLTLLILGVYPDGWRKYEHRFLVPGHDPPRPGAQQLLLNEVAGQRVLLFPEQGRGDMIQMARYIPLLAERGARVMVETYDDLAALFATIDGVESVVGPLDDPPDHDLMVPLLSLPLAFHSDPATIPANVPYVRVPAERLAFWADRMGPHDRPRVGVMWRGAQHIPKRSVPIAKLEPVLRQDGVAFHALQKDIAPADRTWLERNATVELHDIMLGDFADTAALIAHMDLVISIDTSVAHLAGALGVPVWIMLPFSPDWRWLRDREDSPWYPTARLFRQTQRGNWDDVVRRVADALSVERFQHEIEGDQHGVIAPHE